MSPHPLPKTYAADSLSDILSKIYGDHDTSQKVRYTSALDKFWDEYGPGPTVIFRAPGRVNLIGGHTDYNHGYVLPVALDRDIILIARPRPDHLVRLSNAEPEFPAETFQMSDNIPFSESYRWSNYFRGAAQMVARTTTNSGVGMDCLVVGEAPFGVPRGSGLSSSSALTVAAAIALAHFADLKLEPNEFVRFCSDAEWYVGTRGGIMDQFISLYARRNHALFLDCRPCQNGTYTTNHVPLPDNYEIIIAETGVRHENARGEYNKRVAACRSGVGLLNTNWPLATHLRDFENIEWGLLEPYLPEEITVRDALAHSCQIGDIPGLEPDDKLRIQANCRHVWHENQRVRLAYQALNHGNITEAGRLVSLAHASARDNYNISFPEMELLILAARSIAGVMGGRITGAGWGGCAVFLVQKQSVPTLQRTLQERFFQQYGRVPNVYPCRSGTAAGYVATIDG